MQVLSKSTVCASAARKRCVRGTRRFGCVSAAQPWFFFSSAVQHASRWRHTNTTPRHHHHLLCHPPAPSVSSSSQCFISVLLFSHPHLTSPSWSSSSNLSSAQRLFASSFSQHHRQQNEMIILLLKIFYSSFTINYWVVSCRAARLCMWKVEARFLNWVHLLFKMLFHLFCVWIVKHIF